jgi:hypothetical protein
MSVPVFMGVIVAAGCYEAEIDVFSLSFDHSIFSICVHSLL